jgi:hypothetical protein
MYITPCILCPYFIQEGQGGVPTNMLQKRKIWFTTILLLLLLLAVWLILYQTDKQEVRNLPTIRVGVCGSIRRPAVYDMPVGSDLSMLIKQAEGLKLNADIRHINLETTLQNDSVYHIPSRAMAPESDSAILSDFDHSLALSFDDSLKLLAEGSVPPEIKRLNILYIGYPAVYIIISYYPEFHRISFVHIPHSTLFLANDDRLIDIYFTLGLDPTIKMLENRLQLKLENYIIQDRFSFIKMIDLLGGLDINIDEPYAEAYNLTPGEAKLDGFFSWEYIRFLDFKRIKREIKSDRSIYLIAEDNFKVSPEEWQNAYEMRNHRQRIVMQSMRKAYQRLSLIEQAPVLNQIVNNLETNISVSLILEIYQDVLNTPDFSYGAIPGYYAKEGEKLFYFPDLPSFRRMRNQEIREYLVKHNENQQTAY